MKNPRPLAIFVLLSWMLISACGSCNACSDERAEADAETRVSALAGLMPKSTDAAIVIPELSELPENLDNAFHRLGHFDPDARAIENEINQVLGLRITDIESWDAAGFDPDSSMMFSMVGARPVMAAFLDDKNAFETHFVGRMRRITETTVPIESTTIGDIDFRLSGTGPVSDMAWFHDGAIVVFVFPPLDALDVFETGSAMSVANELGSIAEGESLDDDDAFNEFRRGVGDDYPISLYVHAERYFDRPEVRDGSIGLTGFDSLIEGLVQWSQTNADGAGIGARADEQRIELRAFVGGDEEVLEAARTAYEAEHDVDWGGLLTENTTLATRTSFDLSQAVETYLENLPDDERRTIQRELMRLGRSYNIDINDDIIDALSGQSMFVFYGVGGDINTATRMVMQRRLMGAIRAIFSNSGFLFNLHFNDPDKMDALMNAVADVGSEYLVRRPLEYDGAPVEGFEVFAPRRLRQFPFRVFSADQSLTVATAGIGESAAYEYMTDARDEAKLGDVEGLELGAQFAESPGLNGIYLNFANLRSNMRNISFIAGYANTLRMLHELLITAGVDERGFYASAQLDFSDPIERGEDQ